MKRPLRHIDTDPQRITLIMLYKYFGPEHHLVTPKIKLNLGFLTLRIIKLSYTSSELLTEFSILANNLSKSIKLRTRPILIRNKLPNGLLTIIICSEHGKFITSFEIVDEVV